MKLKITHFVIIAFSILLCGNVKSQQLMFQEGYTDLSSVSSKNRTYITPALDLSNGVSFLKFNNKQNVSDMVSGGLKVYYKAENEDHWSLLASYRHSSAEWTVSTLFLPENTTPVSIMFSGAAIGMNTINLDDIRVLKYKNATAWSEKNHVYVDTLNNRSSTLIKIDISENQISGLPSEINNSVKTPGIPVSCPAGAFIEGEPDCSNNYVDAFNGGCDSNPDSFSELFNCNGTVCGKSGTFTINSIDSRDVDQYSIQISGPATVTLKVVADFHVKIYVISIPYTCNGPSFSSSAANANPGDTASIINYYVSGPTTLVFWVAPQTVTGIACGSNYVMKYQTATITNPATPVANPACAPTQLSPMSQPSDYTYYWQGTSCGMSTSSSASIAYPVNVAGTYYVRGIYTPLGCWTPCSSVNIGTGIVPTFTAIAPINSGDPLAPLPTTSNNGITGTWAPALNNTATTTYTFTPNTGQCATTTTLTITVTTYTDVSSNIAAKNLVVYPNPSSERLYINFDELKAVPKSMKLFNTFGQVCYETNNPSQDIVEGINVADINSGSYYLQIVFENVVVNKPVIVN